MPSEKLPPLNNAPSARRAKAHHERASPSQSHPMDMAELSSEEKLNEQFRYFRREFIETAASSGVTLPLGLADEKTSQVLTFVRHNGPKILFQIMQSNMESVHLLRCALSLLILTVTMLRRKLIHDPASGGSLVSPGKTPGGIGDSISQWAQLSLSKFSDSGVVQVCMSILIYTFNPSVQELAINLLAAVVAVSREAFVQITGSPNAVNGQVTSIIPPLSTADKSLSINQTKPTSRPNSSVNFKKYDFKYNDAELVLKKKSKEKKAPSEEQHSCLAYILSLCLLQKNRHLLLAGCADIMLSMLHWDNSPEMHETLASTPTCELPAADLHSKNGNSNGAAVTKTGNASNKFNGSAAVVAKPTNPLANQVIEWAGLKMFLKFLHRHLKVTQFARADAMPRDEVSASIRLRDEFTFGHLKVFTISAALIVGSGVVSDFAHEMPGVTALLKLSAAVHYPLSLELESALHRSIAALAAANGRAKQRELEKEAENLAYSQNKRESNQYQSGNDNLNNTTSSSNLYSNVDASNNNGDDVNVNVSTQSKAVDNHSRRTSDTTGGAASQQSLGAPKHSAGSPTKTMQHNEKINLVAGISVNFQSPAYEIETEKQKLYLLLRSLDSASDAAAAAELIYQENKKRNSQPLPPDENLLTDQPVNEFNASVDFVNSRPTTGGAVGKGSRPNTSDKNYTDPARLTPLPMRTIAAYSGDAAARQQDYNQQNRSMATNNSSTSGSRAGLGLATPGFFKGGENRNSGQDMLNTSGGALKSMSFIDSKTDFFDKLSRRPLLPSRIEPQSVITPEEDMEHIREKFKQISDDAVHHIKDKLGYFREGKGSISIAERARRIYIPTRSSSEQLGLQDSTATSSGQGLGASSYRDTGTGTGNNSSSSRNIAMGNTGGSVGGGPAQQSSAYEEDFEQQSSAEDGASHAAAAEEDDDDYYNGNGSRGKQQSQQQPQHMKEEEMVDEAQIMGLKLDTTDFDDQSIFDGFKPIFDPPVVAPPDEKDYKTAGGEAAVDGENETAQIGGTGRHVKISLEVAQAVDLIE